MHEDVSTCVPDRIQPEFTIERLCGRFRAERPGSFQDKIAQCQCGDGFLPEFRRKTNFRGFSDSHQAFLPAVQGGPKSPGTRLGHVGFP